MTTYDIVLNSTQDFQVSGTDFLVGDAGNNYISYIIQASPGHYKLSPQVGCGIDKYLNSTVKGAELERVIRAQLEADGFKAPTIDVSQFASGGPIIVDKTEVSLS